MPERRRGNGGSRQPDLFARSKQPKISLPDNHPMVVLTDTVDWTQMEVRAAKIRGRTGSGAVRQSTAVLRIRSGRAERRTPARAPEQPRQHSNPPPVAAVLASLGDPAA